MVKQGAAPNRLINQYCGIHAISEGSNVGLMRACRGGRYCRGPRAAEI
jgi:hypothetical protein